MKQILTLLLFLVAGQNCLATQWAWYYIYVQTEYVQGPWTRADMLEKSGSYQYLHPKQFEDLFGTEEIDLASAIFNHLQKETPERYTFKSTLSLSSDTVIIQTNETIADFDAVKNEVTASYALNNFIAVKIVQPGKTTVYQLKDISIPYMDLVLPLGKAVDTIFAPSEEDTINSDTLSSVSTTETLTNEAQENGISIWLLISAIINLLLIFLLLRRKK